MGLVHDVRQCVTMDLKEPGNDLYVVGITKDELGGPAAFYSTPIGQALVDKTPEVSGKMQSLMMPRMMQSMQKMAQASQAFGAVLAAKHAAAPAEAAPVAPATPKP